ncbi:MAG: hypothetical protein CMM78_10395 [Rhodospirillaceae bacterium]|nr:hypothetical protein [Rhodospirillaceae bacterium]
MANLPYAIPLPQGGRGKRLGVPFQKGLKTSSAAAVLIPKDRAAPAERNEDPESPELIPSDRL